MKIIYLYKIQFLGNLKYSVLQILFLLVTNILSQEIVAGVSFQIVRPSLKSTELINVAQKLVTIKKGQILDTVSLEASVGALQACRLFEHVEVEQSRDQINFLLTPARYVRDIIIKRELPLFEDDVEKAMGTYPGDIFANNMIGSQDSLITELYKREGFICPQVKVTSKEHRKGTDQVVLVKINAGEYYHLKKIEIKGNNALSDFHIKVSMNSWRTSLIPGSAGRFKESVFREDIKRLISQYKSRKFADIEINDTIITDSLNREVRVVLSITEGYRYFVHFPKKRESGYRKGTLRNDIAIYKNGNRNNLGVKNTVKNIEKRLTEEGFLDSKAAFSDTTIHNKKFINKNVYFSINPGERTTISSIIISGALQLDEETIRAQMLLVDRGNQSKRAYNPDKLQEDVFAIKMLYRSRGFLKATVKSNVELQGYLAAITIEINEGIRTIIGKVTVDTTKITDNDKVITSKRGDPYRLDILKRDANLLQSKIAEYGYSHVIVNPVITLSNDSSSADINFDIDKGPMVFLGQVRYIGAFRTRKKVLKNKLSESQGKPLSLKEIVNTQKELRDLGLFNSVRFRTIGLREKQDTVNVFIEVTEKRPFYGSIGGGYQSDIGPIVNAKVGDRNVLGLNKEAWISGEVSKNGGNGAIAFLEPKLFGTHINAKIELSGKKELKENQKWGTKEYGISNAFINSIGKGFILTFGSRYERCQLFGNISDTSINVKPRNILNFIPSLTLDRRDSFTRPRKGAVFNSSIDVSKSIENTIDDLVKIHIESKAYMTPLSYFTIAGVLRGGYLYSYGASPIIPKNQQFYLGGTKDIRGFKTNLFHPEDSSGGTTMLFGSIEARIDIGLNIELTTFTDIGRLESDFKSISKAQFRSSAGLGIRYITPIGPIGLLYGWKLDRKEGERPGAFHFSLGYTF